jgi:phosphoribosyl-ATP pyrophosphohydrolase
VSDILHRLEATIAARKASGDTQSSHTAQLLAKGAKKCAQKFGEEAVETVIAAVMGDREAVIDESADALYHLLVTLAAMDVAFDDVLRELERREGTSGVAEKASRNEEN